MKEGGEMPWIYIFAFAIYFLNDAKDRYFLILISSIIEEHIYECEYRDPGHQASFF